MFLPLGDSPNPPGTPVVTYGLVAVNVAVYLLITLPLSAHGPDLRDPVVLEYVRSLVQNAGRPIPVQAILQNLSAYDVFLFHYGFRPAAPALPNLFYSMFLHAGFVHLAGNMLFLWIYGDNVEYRLGRVRYLLAYLGTGVVATLFHTLFASGSTMPLVGASGAISGTLGFYFLWFPRNRVRLLLLFPFFVILTVSARLLIGMFIVLDNLLPFLLAHGAASGVAYGAHIGGFLSGLGTAFWVDRRQARAAPRWSE